ncbi:MAG: DUF6502 family protein [Thiolinea sp.]
MSALSPSQALQQAAFKILRALVRFLLRQQVTYPSLCQWLKSIYVEVAEKEFPVEGKPQTDSRITLLTGVHRKDVRRLRQIEDTPENIPEALSLGAALVATWAGDPEFQDENGKPKPLARLSKDDGGASFEKLVSSVSKDIRPRSVLDEWLRLGICRLDDDGQVWLNSDAFVPEKGLEEKLYYLGRNVQDHIATCSYNINNPDKPFIERSAYYDELTQADVDILADYAREVGMEALLKLNQKALLLQRASEGKADAVHRMNFGVYFYEEKMRNVDAGEAESESTK